MVGAVVVVEVEVEVEEVVVVVVVVAVAVTQHQRCHTRTGVGLIQSVVHEKSHLHSQHNSRATEVGCTDWPSDPVVTSCALATRKALSTCGRDATTR